MTTARMRDKRVKLGEDVLRKRRVYLDTRFWIDFRDVSLGRSCLPELAALYDQIAALVSAGKVICPASEALFAELLRQKSFQTRIETARVVDKLSAGVALQDSKLRTKAELLRFVRANMDPAVRYRPYQAYCWTRVGYVLGDVFPFVAGIPPAVQERLQDSYDDEIWRRSLEDIVTTLSDPLPAFAGDTQWLDDLARGLNEGKFAHANEVTSFRTVYEAELWGIVECYSDEFASLLAYVHASSGSRARPPTESAKIEGGRLFRNLVFHALRLGKAHTELPTFHITASIHAAMRWDRQRRFRPNDWLDFKHAGAALPLCDMFLTDASLAQLLQSGPPRLAEVYGVSVVSDPAAALRLLRQLQ